MITFTVANYAAYDGISILRCIFPLIPILLHINHQVQCLDLDAASSPHCIGYVKVFSLQVDTILKPSISEKIHRAARHAMQHRFHEEGLEECLGSRPDFCLSGSGKGIILAC